MKSEDNYTRKCDHVQLLLFKSDPRPIEKEFPVLSLLFTCGQANNEKRKLKN